MARYTWRGAGLHVAVLLTASLLSVLPPAGAEERHVTPLLEVLPVRLAPVSDEEILADVLPDENTREVITREAISRRKLLIDAYLPSLFRRAAATPPKTTTDRTQTSKASGKQGDPGQHEIIHSPKQIFAGMEKCEGSEADWISCVLGWAAQLPVPANKKPTQEERRAAAEHAALLVSQEMVGTDNDERVEDADTNPGAVSQSIDTQSVDNHSIDATDIMNYYGVEHHHHFLDDVRRGTKKHPIASSAADIFISGNPTDCTLSNWTTKYVPRCQLGFPEANVIPFLVTSVGGSGTTFLAGVLRRSGIDSQHEAVGFEATVGWANLFNLNSARVYEALRTKHLKVYRGRKPDQAVEAVRKQCRKGKVGALVVGTGRLRHERPCWHNFAVQIQPYLPRVSQDHSHRYGRVLHQVRDPLKVLTSMGKFCGHDQIWHFAQDATPSLEPFLAADKSTRYANSPGTCARMLAQHWITWNLSIEPHADWTYRIENTTIGTICERATEGNPALRAKCDHSLVRMPVEQQKKTVRVNTKEYQGKRILSAKALIKLDCKLALKLFRVAVRYGYTKANGFRTDYERLLQETKC